MPGTPVPNRATTPTRVALPAAIRTKTGRFRARFRPASIGRDIGHRHLRAGHRAVDIAVPARPIARGETIGQGSSRPPFIAGAARGDTLRRPEELVGLRAARLSGRRAGRRGGDFAAPGWSGAASRRLCASSVVAWRSSAAAMPWTRAGGRVCPVQNAGSGEVRRAIVVGPRQVPVSTLGAAP